MHELQEQLECVFGASILFISINRRPNMPAASFQLGQLYTHYGAPNMTVSMEVIRKDAAKYSRPFNPMHAFEGITRYAAVTSISTGLIDSYPTTVYKVEFSVFDFESFMKDITAYCWLHFSDQFNKQLDGVLEKE